MKRAGVISLLICIVAFGLVVGMSIRVPSGSWGQSDDLLEGRSGAASALLPGGGVLVTGGTAADGTVLAQSFSGGAAFSWVRQR